MRKTLNVLAVMAAVTVSACGSSGEPRPADAGTPLAEVGDTRVAVEIRNNLIPAATVNAFYMSGGGRARRLGTVRSNSTETFVIETRLIAGGFVLSAEVPQREVITSQRITDVARVVIRWNLGTNILNIERMP
ncbi:MAG: hypothetical protein OEU54_00190 [Gemmatimonadota bacterium]|nr:hypothetical protein [Gemmatimonadota bacterium]